MKQGLIKGLAALALTAALAASTACAESISFTGQVTAKTTREVYAPIGGMVESVLVQEGERIGPDDVLATLTTTKVYAAEDGTVTGVFGQPGDATETVAERYGAVLYVEETAKYTLSASVENAYNSTDTKYVHVGETVYLVSRSDSSRTGTGVITAAENTSYTVQVESGSFLLGESADIYRSETHKAATRIGRGTVARKNPTAYSGTGSIVCLAVKDGDQVSRGDLLFETADGSFDGLYMSGMQVYCGVEGIVSQVQAQQGSAVQKDSVMAVVYPLDAMTVVAEVAEDDLAYVAQGDAVSIELNWNQDEEITYPGTVSMISGIATEGETGEVTYKVYIDFTPDENTRYGMSAVVSTLDQAEAGDHEQ